MLYWSKLLVDFFQTSEFNAPPADLLTGNFHRKVESVTEFGQRISELPPNEAQGKFERILLHGLMDTKVGLYSTFHDNAGECYWPVTSLCTLYSSLARPVAYHHGYGHPSTIRLAYM
jgi:hypothetical protein